MRTIASLFLATFLLVLTAPVADAAVPRLRQRPDKGLIGYCVLIKMALKKGESVTPSADNQDRFDLSISMLTKASALCDAMLDTSDTE